MLKRHFPGLPLDPSVLSLGTVILGTGLSEDDSFRMLDYYAEQGGNLLDTALVYGDFARRELGRSERTLGRWCKVRGCRSQVLLATKGGHPVMDGRNIPRLSRQEIKSDLATSLENLQTDRIDLYWLHRDDPKREVAEVVETMNELLRAGHIGLYGLSNWTSQRLAAAADYAQRTGLTPPAASQILWNLAKPNPEDGGDPTIVSMTEESYAWYRQSNLPVFAFTSQARGYFSKLAKGEAVADWVLASYDNDANRERLAQVQALAKARGVSVEAVVLAYLTCQPFPVFPILGASSLKQLASSLEFSDLKLTPEEVAGLTACEPL